MRSKNSKPLTLSDRAHLARVRALPCSWCGKAGGYAHHIKQGQHWTTVATCWDCHQGPQGWHGDKTLQRIFKMDELDALAVTLQALYEA